MKKSMVISLIGRPNVGKSSLFNRLMKRANKALTHDEPGVTRDRHYGIANFDDLSYKGEEEREAILVDTGGFYPDRINEDENNASKFFNIMADHAHIAIDESDLVLFVVDVREGALPFDETIANYIRTQKKKFWLLINKYDSDKQMGEEAEFYNLGLDPEEMFLVSAAHGGGIDPLRERLHEELLKHQGATSHDLQKGVTPREKVVARLALVGAPNAGKSTLLNQLVGAERALVSNIPGTTVDPIEGFFDMYFGKEALELEEETHFVKSDGLLFKQYEDFRKNNPDVYQTMIQSYEVEESETGVVGEVDALREDQEIIEASAEASDIDSMYKKVFEETTEEKTSNDTDEGNFWRSLHLVDTAGIRKQRSIKDFIESQSVYRSLRCITESDMVLFLVDATKGIGHQDRRLIDIALEKGKSVVVCLNKIDLLKEKLKTEKERKEWLMNLRDQVPWLYYCDILPISAKYKKGMKGLRNAIKKTIMVRRRSIPTGELNRFMVYLTDKHPIIPKGSRGKRFKVKYASMVKSDPPTFLFFTNKSKGLPENYRRYIKNGLRSQFELSNTPIHLLFRTGSDLERRFKERGGK